MIVQVIRASISLKNTLKLTKNFKIVISVVMWYTETVAILQRTMLLKNNVDNDEKQEEKAA